MFGIWINFSPWNFFSLTWFFIITFFLGMFQIRTIMHLVNLRDGGNIDFSVFTYATELLKTNK